MADHGARVEYGRIPTPPPSTRLSSSGNCGRLGSYESCPASGVLMRSDCREWLAVWELHGGAALRLFLEFLRNPECDLLARLDLDHLTDLDRLVRGRLSSRLNGPFPHPAARRSSW